MPINSLVPTNSVPPAAGETGTGRKKLDEQKLKRAGEDFEALFINQLLQSMRRTVIKSNLMGEAPGKEIYQSLFDREISQKMARQEALGLGKEVVRLVRDRNQGKTASPAAPLNPLKRPGLSVPGGSHE